MDSNNQNQNDTREFSLPDQISGGLRAEKTSKGALIGSIIIIIILVLGAIFVIGKSKGNNTAAPQPSAQAESSANPASTLSSSDNLDSIQTDLNATDSGINSADQGLQ